MALLCLGLLASLATGPQAALAQAAAASEEDIAAARVRFAEGLALSDAAQWEAAAAVFHEVLAVVSSPPVLFNLAHALVELNQFDEADELIERVLADPTTDRDIGRRTRQLRTRMTQQGGQLTLQAGALPAGSVVLLNGRPLAAQRLDQALRVSPGTHHVTVTDAPGGAEIAVVDVSVTRRGRQTLALAPDATLVAAAEARAAEAARLEAEAVAHAAAEAEREQAERAELARLEAEYEASRRAGHTTDTESAFAVRQAQLAREREAEELRRAAERSNRDREAVPLQRNWRFWTVVGVVAAAAVGVGVAVAVSGDDAPNRGALGNFSPGRVEF